MPSHNQALAGDVLTTIRLNFEWRKIVASALSFYWAEFFSDLGLDNEDLRNSLLIDLYSVETLGMDFLTTTVKVDLGANRTTTSSTYIAVPSSSFLHNFTKPNAIIRCYNIAAVVSVGGADGRVQVVMDGSVGLGTPDGNTESTAIRTLTALRQLTGITPGAHTIELYFASSGGISFQIAATTKLIFEIFEYDDNA